VRTLDLIQLPVQIFITTSDPCQKIPARTTPIQIQWHV